LPFAAPILKAVFLLFPDKNASGEVKWIPVKKPENGLQNLFSPQAVLGSMFKIEDL